jgi:hypothetical protein
MCRAPTDDQVERARGLAQDLLDVLRMEYEKARMGGGPTMGYQGYQAGAAAQDPYAGYYAVSQTQTTGYS